MSKDRVNVLLVDDNKGDFIIIRKLLSKIDQVAYDLDWETDFEKAKDTIARNRHDVYLVDFRLGDGNGLDLIREYITQMPRKPMILLTAHGNVEIDQKAIRMGAADYLPKDEISATLLDRTIRHSMERCRLLGKLYYQATHDELTGLFNRQHLIERLAVAISSARRHKIPLSLCLCDVDHFKSINDRYGHRTGDIVLSTIGKLFLQHLREEDIPGRYGGDEFCIVFPHVTPEEARISLERLRIKIEKTVFTSESKQDFSTTVTFGVAALSQDKLTPDAFISAADQALYSAKNLGRNCTRIHN